MTPRLLAMFLVGLALVTGVVGYVWYRGQGRHLVPTGSIAGLRTVALDDNSSGLVLDFEASNSTDYDMIVRTFGVSITKPDGGVVEGDAIGSTDLPALFRYHPELGANARVALRSQLHIKPHQTLSGLVAVRFDLPERDLKARKGVSFFVEDVTGPKLELSAK